MAMSDELLKQFEKIKALPYGTGFFKADLHFHTPASEDARGSNRYNFNPYKIAYPKKDSPNYQKAVKAVQEDILVQAQALAAKIVERFIEVELSVVAITDHNGIGTIWADHESDEGQMDLAAPTWYELIDDAAQQVNLTRSPQADGSWKVADADPGFPAGKGKSVLVDLTGKLGVDGRIRIRSTQRIHWDAFSVSTAADREYGLNSLHLIRAEHKYRGVGRRVDDPEGEQPRRYSHDELLDFVPYDQMPMGMVTKYGDVRPLLIYVDDQYRILATGDVVELSSDATGLPLLHAGWVRDYCLTTEGWVKDADMNQAIRETVTPLPFHGMSGYPYDESKESHPRPDFVAQWLTRPFLIELRNGVFGVHPQALVASF